jgi:hypothetical protein
MTALPASQSGWRWAIVAPCLFLWCCADRTSRESEAALPPPPAAAPEKPRVAPAGTLCTLSGDGGDTSDCVLTLARSQRAAPNAVMIRVHATYDPAAITPESYAHCPPGKDCKFTPLRDGPLTLPKGHEALTCLLTGSVLGKGCDPGDLIALVYGIESHDITEAYLDEEGKVHGNPELMRFRFMLRTKGPHHITTTEPDDLQATDESAGDMGLRIRRPGADGVPAQLVTHPGQ